MSRASAEKIETASMVLAKIKAYDPSFPNPNEASVLAWAETLTRINTPRDVALEAVTRMYLELLPTVHPMPGLLAQHCRDIMRERLAPHEERLRAEREARIDARVEGRKYEPPQPVETIYKAEWERRHGERFPRIERVGKPIPADRPPRMPLPGSGHTCELPKVRRGHSWVCEECFQKWTERDKQWRMCE